MSTFIETDEKYTPGYKIYPDTKIGKNAYIGEYVILGVPSSKTTTPLIIGDNANIRSHSIIYSGNNIGDNFQTGHSAFIQQDNKLGNDVSLGTKSVILSDCIIEDSVRIHTQVFIPEWTIIKKGSWIGPNVVLTNTRHPTCKLAKKCFQSDGIKIEEGVIIGANTTILPGIKIGQRAIIGAGSVVTKDVSEEYVVFGNPAILIKMRSELKCPHNLIESPYQQDPPKS